jgi:predicted metalloprotease with PDZ domain
MTKRRLLRPLSVILLFALVSVPAIGAAPDGAMAFTVSMPRPESHTFHVSFRFEGVKAEIQDFLMPAWMPGFYRIMDYEKNVSNFRAADGAGRPLGWEKVTRNTWRVVCANSSAVVLDYDVYGDVRFVAQNDLDGGRAFIAPPGMFLYPAGRTGHPVTVTILLPEGWTRIATGLDPVAGRPGTFSAPDFDVLFDCPILLGSQEAVRFEVKGVPHEAVIEDVPAEVDRKKMADDLGRIVRAATDLMGDIPYRHYTFLLMGKGNGGIEHLNSAACSFNGKGLVDEKGYRGWLSYISHEYFHNFNVKRVRPLALGPFDYETENLTDMLWVSEGLTVYYEDIVMVRAGLMTAGQYLERMQAAMTRFENTPGRRYMSATESSLGTWSGSGFGGDRNTTISYYDNGAMLGAMLDLAIRNDSGNRKSLDDVMRTLYRRYAKERKRGFTDAEFRAECEAAAGTSLAEVFEYASTTKDIDYAKYFAYAGLRVVDTPGEEAPGAYLGVDTQEAGGKLAVSGASEGSPARKVGEQAGGTLVVSGTSEGSPAAKAGLVEGDEILELDGTPAATKVLSDLLAAKKPGETVKIRFSRGGGARDTGARNGVTKGTEARDAQARDIEIVLGANVKHNYIIERVSDPTPLQASILKAWLKLGSDQFN